MVYGSANYVDLPWETLIKAFRRDLGERVFPTLSGYVDAFLQFIGRSEPLISGVDELKTAEKLIVAIIEDIRVQLSGRFDRQAEDRDGLSPEEVSEISNALVRERTSMILNQPFLEGFSDADIEPAVALAKPLAESMLAELFGSLPIQPEVRDDLVRALGQSLVRRYAGPFISGVVFAGFGEDEYLPVMVNVEIEERALGRPRIVNRKEQNLRTTNAAVVPYAQRDAVTSFLEGVEPSLRDGMKDSVAELFGGALQVITDELRSRDGALADSFDAALRPGLTDLLDRLFVGWESMRRQHWSPVLNMVGALPKDELASVAEALVNLTKFRRRVTPVSESVGGPIDVALITKGDGFVWIRRKHYFQAELNPRAIRRLSES